MIVSVCSLFCVCLPAQAVDVPVILVDAITGTGKQKFAVRGHTSTVTRPRLLKFDSPFSASVAASLQLHRTMASCACRTLNK